MAKTGAPLAIEGIRAFFMEATFFAVMFFGLEDGGNGAAFTIVPGIKIPKMLSILATHNINGFVPGINNTAYYPSYTDLQSSLTIRNSSSSYFTLQVMSCVSLLIPFVLAYIVYAWRQMDRKKITEEEITSEEHKY